MNERSNAPAALIIGGGIAGIQAALDIADAGFQVYLVEREPSIGGRMAQLDKTFPTLDCSSCILTPRMVEAGRHSNIELMTYSEVVSVESVNRETGRLVDRETGKLVDWETGRLVNWETGRLVNWETGKLVNRETGEQAEKPETNLPIYQSTSLPVYQSTGLPIYRVRVRKKARYVDMDKCIGCGLCAEACRMHGRVSSTFDAGVGKRAAIYVPFPQAVPLKYTVDPETCIFLTRGVCGKTFLCKDACAFGAIDFDQQDEFVDLDVGAIIVATGFDPFDPTEMPEFGYGQYPEVMTGLEFERLVSASGPTAGKIKLPLGSSPTALGAETGNAVPLLPEKDGHQIKVNGKEPQEVIFIQCVGSRDAQHGHPYCSRVCCMYTAKQAHLVCEKLPDALVTIFYMDIRAFGKGFEEFYDRVRREGVIYRRGNPSEIIRRGDKLIVRAEDTLLGEPVEVEADLVVLAIGMQPRADAEQVADLLGLARSDDGFFQEAHPKLRPVDTGLEGIYLAGCCQSPKDIPDTVAQAKAAAAAAMIRLASNNSTIRQ